MEKEEFEEQERRSFGLRMLAVVVTVVLLVIIGRLCVYKVERRRYREAYEAALILDRQKRLQERENSIAIERKIRDKQIQDSIDRANCPVYINWDLWEAIESHAPEDVKISLWRKWPEEWMMVYHRGEHRYSRCFNPTTRKFQKERPADDEDVTEDGWIKFNYEVREKPRTEKPHQRHIQAQAYDDGFDEDEYEDYDDYFYDEEDDLRFYYGL